MKSRALLSIISVLLTVSFIGCQSAEPPAEEAADTPSFEGRWDLSEDDGERTYVSWLEVTSDGEGWKGRFLHRGGHAVVSQVEISGDELKVTMLPEAAPANRPDRPDQPDRPERPERIFPVLTGKMEGERLVGTGTSSRGDTFNFSGDRAPDRLEGSDREVEWGEPIQLFDGTDMSSWETIGNRDSLWKVEDGLMVNEDSGANIRTVGEYRDFKLHVEFRIPEGSNSGIYLRGRYETQVADNYGAEPFSRGVGGIYGYITPTVNAAKPAGEWNTIDATLIGYRVTIVVNGVTTIDGQLIDGITGGALDPNESDPGPIMLQGDHGTVSYRNIVLTPAN